MNISTEMLFITTSLASDALGATELLIDYCNGSETEIRGKCSLTGHAVCLVHCSRWY